MARPARTRGHLALLSLGALGVVYGDIGTSPLYAFREAIHATEGRAGDEAGVLGILSLLLWTLLVVVTIKYLAVVMRADNHGEGGILALTSLLLPKLSGASGRRWLLIALGLFGTALLYGDGAITPAISVLAAVEGLELAAPGLEPYVVPLTIAILVGLFAAQHLGTARVGAVFGPVMTAWFATLSVLGITQIVRAPEVLAAASPLHALRFVTTDPGVAFLALGGVFLVVTGAEALYADMGHFGRSPIRLGWFSVVLPALVLNYFGQGALLLINPAAAREPFFLMAPGWALLPLVALATLATVIASQALISGAFSLTMQAVQIGFLPRVRINHTSPNQFGQVYLPAVNVILCGACIALVLIFRSSAGLAGAYGMAVVSTMVITTVLLLAVSRELWRWPLGLTLAVGAGLLAVDGSFFAVNVAKIPAGGWLPLAGSVVLFTVMTTWHRGREHVTRRRRLGAQMLDDYAAWISEQAIPRVGGTAVYLGADLDRAPTALEQNVATHHVLHEQVYVVTVEITDLARIPPGQRAEVRELGQGFCRILLRFGFMDEPDVPTALRQTLPADAHAALDSAVYFVGLETIVATEIPGMALWRERLFVLLHRNASTIVRYFRLPRDRIVEVGSVVAI